MKKIIFTIIISITTVVFLLGFIDRTPEEAAKSTADLTYSINDIPENLKSVGQLSKREQDVICATSRGLIEVDIDGNIVPSLAESVEIKDEGIEYDFKLRDDIYWSDGSKITPKDFALFLREVITEEIENKTLLNVFGVNDYINSNKSFNDGVGISTTDTNIIIRLNSPDDNFLKELAKPQYRLRKNLLFWENIKGNYTSIPYSGNYCINSIGDEQIELIRSSKANVELPQTIHLVKDEEEDLALAAFEIGKRDIVISPPKSQLERLKGEGKLITLPSDRAMYLAFNSNAESLLGTTKQEIYRLINKAISEYQSNNSILADVSGCSYFREDQNDLTKLQSRNVMMNVDNDNIESEIKKIVLVTEESIDNKELVDFLSEWFDKNTEIVLNTNLVSSDEMKDIDNKLYYDIALINVNATLDNESEFFDTISNYIPDELRTKAQQVSNKEEREGLFAEIEDSLFNNFNVVPLLFYNENIAVNKLVKNITLDGNGNINFNNIKK